jgi:hypothetical protein
MIMRYQRREIILAVHEPLTESSSLDVSKSNWLRESETFIHRFRVDNQFIPTFK